LLKKVQGVQECDARGDAIPFKSPAQKNLKKILSIASIWKYEINDYLCASKKLPEEV